MSNTLYTLGPTIGKGTFSRVYATSDPTGRPLAIKCALNPSKAYLLTEEADKMRKLARCTYVPKLVCVLQAPVSIVMERVGKTLLTLQQELQRFSVKSTAMLALQMLSALEELHSFGFLHRDIKPDNLALSPDSASVRLIDLGLSSSYLKNGRHVAYSEQNSFQGTPFFCSLACLKGVRASRRDDLEALGYVLVFLQKGFLPWFDCDAMANLSVITEKRLNYPVKKLCEGLEPEFEEFIRGCQAIGFSDLPNYTYFRSKFTSLLRRLGEDLDWKYDWTLKSRKIRKTSTFRNKAQVKSQRRISLPVTQADCEEQLTPVASIAQLPTFKFKRLRPRLNTEKREFKGFRPSEPS